MVFPIRVNDVMSSPVETIAVDETVAVAAAECFERDIGSLVVVDGDDVVGIVTGMDLLEVLGTVEDPGGHPIRDAMSAPVVTTSPETPVGEAVDTMADNHVARLVVIEDGSLVGIVSTDDVVRYVPQSFHRSELPAESGADHHYDVRPETAYEKSDWQFTSRSVAEDEVSVGDRVEFTKVLSEADVRTFAAASGDTNRLHLDEEYARETRFGRRIVHGTLVSGLISAALARLPGLTIYLSQDLSFLAPVDVGEEVTAVCEIVGTFGRNKYELRTDVVDSDDERVIEGEATVLVDAPPESERIEIEALA